MLKRAAVLSGVAALLVACATAPGGMQRASPPSHATGEGIGSRSPASAEAAPAAPPVPPSEHRHY
jgi:starvation-inducible outer membrane lipoprotein